MAARAAGRLRVGRVGRPAESIQLFAAEINEERRTGGGRHDDELSVASGCLIVGGGRRNSDQ